METPYNRIEVRTEDTLAGRLDELLRHKKANGVPASAIASELGVIPGLMTYYRNGTRPLPPERLIRLAEILGVRACWLLSGEGCMRRTADIFEVLALHEVDGLRREWDFPSIPKDDGSAVAFTASFHQYGTTEFHKLHESVRLLFTNLIALVFERLHQTGHATTDPGWRGEVAGLELHRVKAAAQGAGFNRHLASTRKWVQAMGDELERWEVENPDDFEVPTDTGS